MIKRRAFTLVELLVVISIIALLMAILMPSLAKVKKQAMEVVCKNNLRQLAMGMSFYAGENNDLMMPIIDQPGEYWFHLIAPYLGQSKNYHKDPELVMKVAYCPATKEQDVTLWGTKNRRWQWWPMGTSGSYGLNLWFTPKGWYSHIGNPGNYFRKFSQARSTTPLLSDAIWVGGWPEDTDPVPASLDGDFFQIGMARFYNDRHEMSINVAFAGGHVDDVDLKKLWRLKWHKRFVPTEIIVPYGSSQKN